MATSLTGQSHHPSRRRRGDVALIVLVFRVSLADGGVGRPSPGRYQEPRVTTYLVSVVGDSLIGRSLADQIAGVAGRRPASKHDTVLTVPGDIEDAGGRAVDDPSLAIYLLDGRGIIRWMEKGTATPEGLDTWWRRRGLLEPLAR